MLLRSGRRTISGGAVCPPIVSSSCSRQNYLQGYNQTVCSGSCYCLLWLLLLSLLNYGERTRSLSFALYFNSSFALTSILSKYLSTLLVLAHLRARNPHSLRSSYQMSSSGAAISSDTIVALAIGLPSLLVATLALWVAYLTFTHSRRPIRSTSWPEPAQAWAQNASSNLTTPRKVLRSRRRVETTWSARRCS